MTKTAAWHFPYALFEARLGDYPLRHGTMRMMLYHPDQPNTQSPHDQDELYLVETGRGTFNHAGDIAAFGPGDVIFVEAGIVHQFEDFDADLRVWVVFWGPSGGERKNS